MTVTADLSTGKFVQAGDYRVHYHEAGEGPAVIMLHGAGPGATAWANYRGNIETFAQSRRTILLDMPGFGGSDSIVSVDEAATTIRARVIRDVMDELGIERASFVGNSYGGAVAMAIAVDYPERVERLILMAAAGTLKTITALQPTEGHRAMRIASKNPSEETMRPVIAAFMSDPSKLPDEEFQRRIEAAKKQPLRETPMGTSQAPWRDQEPELHRIQAKTLIVWGREDRVNPLEIGLLLLREIPDSRLYVVRDCGHWVQIEARDEFNRVALEFLAA
jgi:pimeloyl-ACP methyl ester carboxylesterase